MDAGMVIEIVQQALLLTLIVSAPAVLTATVVGLVVSVVQAATQVQEQMLTVAPKLIAVFAVLAVTGLVTVTTLMRFASTLLEMMPRIS